MNGLRFPLPLLVAAVLSAADTTVQMDPAQTKLEFTLSDILHTVHGTFRLKHGTMRFDPATGAASGELVVDAASGDSGSGARDKRMHTNILESAKYPDIVFRPRKIVGALAAEGTSQVQVEGTFSIHGSDHEIAIPLEVHAGERVYKVSGQFDVPYVKWGMKNPSTFILHVGETVQIRVETVAR